MNINKYTASLAALGVISLAGVAQAANPTVYLTGSTAARAVIYNAATMSGGIFTAGGTVVAGSNGNSSSQIVFEGNITGLGTVDLSCDFTGSEAGIAATAQQPLQQTLYYQNANGQLYNLPGVPANNFFTYNGTSWVGGQTVNPDLTMADTTQGVSLTSAKKYALVSYGTVGIVTFTFMKGYEKTPDTTSTDLKNVTDAGINQLLGGPIVASFLTGNANDTDFAYTVGRNEGSGTRVNTLLNVEYPVTTAVDQFAFATSAGGLTSLYPTSGTLTFNGSYAVGQVVTDVGNDGFDGGSSVQKTLNVDGTGALDASGTKAVLIGYLGLADAYNANQVVPAGGGAASFLSFNGVFEGDQNVIEGAYPFWGLENLYGAIGQSKTSTQGKVAGKIVSGISAALAATGGSVNLGATGPAAGAVTGDVSTTPGQSVIIPVSSMQANRTQDGGFPAPGSF